jgi:hypothetical protein
LKYFFYTSSSDRHQQLNTFEYPIFETDEFTRAVEFQASFDLLDLLNDSGTLRTYLAFSNPADCLPTYFRTNFGHKIQLTPAVSFLSKPDSEPYDVPDSSCAMLVYNPQVNDETDRSMTYCMVPSGDFHLGVKKESEANGSTAHMLCGLSGTETIAFNPKTGKYVGDIISFFPRQAAFAPVFPLKSASPVGKPVDPKAELLDTTFLTSWATMVRAPKEDGDGALHYVAQPPGANMYGNDGNNNILVPEDPWIKLPEDKDFCFPMTPYAGCEPGDGENGMDAEQVQLFDTEILAQTRRNTIARTGEKTPPPGVASIERKNVTTPSGLIATLDENLYKWFSIQLAQNLNSNEKMIFEEPDEKLRNAFQSNRLLLVATDHEHLGDLKEWNGSNIHNEDETNIFYNTISIGPRGSQWKFQVNVGTKDTNKYNDYKNVMVFKFCPGKLKDLVNGI